MPDKENAGQVEVDSMNRGPLSEEDLEVAAGGSSNDIKPPTLDEGEPSDGSGGG